MSANWWYQQYTALRLWSLKVNNGFICGFPSRDAALHYYREHILPTKPKNVALYIEIDGFQKFQYTII